jgi:hypothetical protein
MERHGVGARQIWSCQHDRFIVAIVGQRGAMRGVRCLIPMKTSAPAQRHPAQGSIAVFASLVPE